MKVIERTKIWFTISLVVILIGIGSMLFKGFNFGIDFQGGTLVEISMGKELNDSEIKEVTDIIKKQDSSAVVTTANNNSQVDVKAGEDTLTEAKLSTITKNIQEKFSDAKLKSDCFAQGLCTGWVINTGNMDYLKADRTGKCPNGKQLSWTNTSCK